MSQSWKKVFVMAGPNSEQNEQPVTPTFHVANTIMINDTLPYVVISSDPGIEFAQQYDFVVSRNSSEVGIQRVIKTIIHIIR